MMKLKPSVQLFSVRDSLEENMQTTLDRLAGIGFEQVELFGFVDRASRFEQALANSGISAPTGHARFIGEGAMASLEAAQRLGVKTLIDPFTQPEDWKDVSKIDFFIEELNRASGQAKEFGITIGYHNHYWELAERVGDQIAFDYFIENLAPAIVIELDTYWCEVGGVSAPQYLQQHKDRIVAIHVKDGTKDGVTDNQVPAGTGEIPVREILLAAPGVLPVIEFDEYKKGDVFEGIAQSLAFVNEVRG